MDQSKLKTIRRVRRKRATRKRIFGTPDRPRLSVFRSQRHIYVQIIDDVTGKTLASASSSKLSKGADADAAKAVGADLAERAKAAGVAAVRFDRNGYKYHGRIKALADAAREGGLKF